MFLTNFCISYFPLNHEALPSVEKGGVGERSIPYKNPVLPARGLLALWEILFYRLGAVFLQFLVKKGVQIEVRGLDIRSDTRVELELMYIFTKIQFYAYIGI